MGIAVNKSSSIKNKQAFDFLISQAYWGHKKQFLSSLTKKYVLGLKSNMAVINPEYFIESINRSSLFCFNLVSNGGNILFINLNENYKKLTAFFAVRCGQRFYVNKWFGGLITNNLLGDDSPSALILSNLSYNSTYSLKESSRKLIPTISVEDTDNLSHKCFYNVFSNDDIKNSVHLFYSVLSDSIVKSVLFKHFRPN